MKADDALDMLETPHNKFEIDLIRASLAGSRSGRMERIATACLAGLLANPFYVEMCISDHGEVGMMIADLTGKAKIAANLLIAQLDQPKE